MNIQELQDTIQSLSEADLNEVKTIVEQAHATRIEERIAQLPEFPWLIAPEGHREWKTENLQHELRKIPGMPFQVRKEVAALLLRANGAYRVATAEEVGQ
ncbi:MAG: hypothetical protein LAQ69_20220 [Acidobacteriia bacterium]|nr:hypothetical protein [Terriglobia bacterium]